jgi:type VI secretion system secreted protein Hcp
MAVNYFMKFDGVQGEVADVLSRNQIRVLSWGWTAHSLSSVEGGGGSGAGKVELEDFTFITLLERSSPQFFRHICAGTHVDSAVVTGWKAGEPLKPWLQMTFKGAFLTNLKNEGALFDEEKPIVHMALSFEQVTIEYKIQNTDGRLISTGPVTYNQMQNKLS